jgi:hypothetical protein
MYDLGPALGAMLASSGAGFLDRSFPGLGFTVRAFDWRAGWGRILDDNQPDVVIFLAGPWDTASITVDGAALAYGSADWRAWYDAELDDFVRLVHGTGAHLVWLTAPTYGPVPTAEDVGPVNDAFRAVATRWPDVVVVDTAHALAGPDGGYSQYLAGPDGPEEARKDDGLHFCPAGAARVADAVLPALRRWWTVAPMPGWQNGPWRSDERYAHPRYGAGCDGSPGG